jgi:2-keto-3-deoxy-L-arabinonate dehydratase
MAFRDGSDSLAMFGLASEYYKLTDRERQFLLRRLLSLAEQKIPVIISVTHHATEIAIRQGREAQDAGAAAIMILLPFFLNPSPAAILEHIECVAGAVEIPAILQYAPAQTSIGPEILASLPVSIVKIDAVPFAPVASALPPGCLRLAGYMGLDLPDAIAADCRGCMPTASLVPQFRRLWDLLRKNPEQGREYHARLLPLLRFMMQSIECLIGCEKHLLVRRNAIRSYHSRRPRACLEPAQVSVLFRYLDEL